MLCFTISHKFLNFPEFLEPNISEKVSQTKQQDFSGVCSCSKEAEPGPKFIDMHKKHTILICILTTGPKHENSLYIPNTDYRSLTFSPLWRIKLTYCPNKQLLNQTVRYNLNLKYYYLTLKYAQYNCILNIMY